MPVCVAFKLSPFLLPSPTAAFLFSIVCLELSLFSPENYILCIKEIGDRSSLKSRPAVTRDGTTVRHPCGKKKNSKLATVKNFVKLTILCRLRPFWV